MIKVIAPFAPFISEELWHRSGNAGSVHHQQFPEYDEKYLKESTVSYPISINGKKRGVEEFSKDMSKDELEKKALELDYVQKWIEGKNVMKVIVVPGRMINIVVK
jgi:leucyl-tRNA synthetase